jgi:hypothetical protein
MGGWRDVGSAPPLSEGVGYGICLGKYARQMYTRNAHYYHT